jgi:hypothetical protein
MDARHFPQNWSSTANDIEATLFAAKDALAVVDDFAPGTTRGSRQELETKAERVVRGLGNAAGRGRMTADGRQRPDRPPRAQVIVTGEDLPAAHSIRARALIVPVAEGDVDTALLTAAQEAARSGVYEHALAGFVTWMAGRHEQVVARWRGCAADYRGRLVAGGVHGRSPVALAQLLAAVEILAEYLDELGIEVPARCSSTWARRPTSARRRSPGAWRGCWRVRSRSRRSSSAAPTRCGCSSRPWARRWRAGGRTCREIEGQACRHDLAPSWLGGRGPLGRRPAPRVARARRARRLGRRRTSTESAGGLTSAVRRLLAVSAASCRRGPATLWGELLAGG